jgi:DNA-binding MarR family transcriptional regulator
MPDQPVEQQEAATAFYAELDMDVSYFPAIWHSYKVGQLMATDLDRICRPYDLSMADIHLLGAMRIDCSDRLRATDLAQTLNVSNAVLSSRIAKLEQKGLLMARPSSTDRRALTLQLTPDGIATLDAAIKDITAQANFVSCYRQLAEQDRSSLTRIMGELHNLMYRHFSSRSRGEC